MVVEELREAGADLEILSLDRVRVKGGKDINHLAYLPWNTPAFLQICRPN